MKEQIDVFDDLLIEFDEMGFVPTTAVPDHEAYAIDWKNRLINALEGYRKQSEWISVEDRLPESEKIVLASAVSKTFRYRHTLMVAHIGHHEFTTEDTDWREFEGDTEYDEENDCFWIPECWYEVNSVEDNGNWIIDSDYDVTHWMPLPEPPEMKGGAE